MSVIGKLGSYFVRGCKVYGPTVFGTGSEAMQKAYQGVFQSRGTKVLSKQFFGDFWAGTKAAGRAAEAEAAKYATQGGFLKNFWKSIKNIPTTLKAGWRLGRMKATTAGTSKLLGGLKGLGKGIAKKIPIIGSLLLVAFEVPNIIKATTEKGLRAGLVETAKAAGRLGGFTAGTAAGAAIGSIFGPVGTLVGGLIGGIAGEWLAGKVVGKSYSEEQAEEQEQLAQAQAQPQEQQEAPTYTTTSGATTTNPIAMTLTPQQIQQYQRMLYGSGNNDFMCQATGLNYLS